MAASNKSLLDKLRLEAEKLLNGNTEKDYLSLTEIQIKELLHELQVQQIELEMQNDELKISNNIIEEQSRRFAGLYALAPVGYLLLNNYGAIEEINDTGLSMLETTKRFAINNRFQSFIQPENKDQFSVFLQRVLARKIRQSCQMIIVSPQGNPFYAQIEGIAIDNNNEFKVEQQCYIALIDITERKKAEIVQQETNQRLEMALSASLTGTWEINIQSSSVSLDQFCYNLFQLSPDQFDGSMESFCSFIHPDDRDWVEKKLLDCLNSKKELDIEHRIVLKHNRIKYVAARGHVIEDQLKQCFVGIMTDITERKHLEKEAQQLKNNQQLVIHEAVLQGQENERERISSALHDSVSQLLYGIKLKVEQEKECSKLFSDLFKNINQLLDQAIKETRNISFELTPSILKDFGLATTVDEMAQRLISNSLQIFVRVNFNERLKINTEMSIFRIVQELTNNCIKHAFATSIHIELLKNGNFIEIVVMDNGRGFKNGYDFPNIGSGLASIKNRLALLDGTMKISSNSGIGSKVTILLKNLGDWYN